MPYEFAGLILTILASSEMLSSSRQHRLGDFIGMPIINESKQNTHTIGQRAESRVLSALSTPEFDSLSPKKAIFEKLPT
jgi:hypothetical protein